MRQELENRLRTEFDFYTGHYGTGLPFECGDGWFDLLYKLSLKIAKHIEVKKLENFGVSQVKEKYGTLRYYTYYEDDLISQFIEEAERESAVTCEQCGKQGEMRNLSGWYMTLCSECLESLEKQRERVLKEMKDSENTKGAKNG